MKYLRPTSISAMTISFLILFAGFAAPSSRAQSLDTSTHKQVVSANPFGLILKFFNAEYERVISESTTAGIGGSSWIGEYVNADVFWRFYPSGSPLNGWAFGVKAGITRGWGEGTVGFGAGFDVNRSWVLGKNDDFYVGLGFGLKRMVVSSDPGLEILPTFRIINVGYLF